MQDERVAGARPPLGRQLLAQLLLDGDWTNPYAVGDATSAVSTFPSGNGAAGGDFEFFFTVLFGDRDRSNQVNLSTDILPALANVGMAGSYGWAQGDFDGSSTVNLSPDILPALANIDADFVKLPVKK